MAAQATILLRKLKDSKESSDVFYVPSDLSSSGLVPSWYKWAGSETSFTKLTPTREDDLKRIIKLQALFRGHRTRKYAQRVFGTKSIINAAGLKSVAEELHTLHKGWRRFCSHMILLVLLCCTAYVQLLAHTPVEHDVELALREAVDSIKWNGDNGVEDVRSIQDLYSFFRGAIQSLYAGDPYVEPLCPPLSCETVLMNESSFEQCVQLTDFSAYLDSFNRQQFGMLFRQQRYIMAPCENRAGSFFDFFSAQNYSDRKCTRKDCALADTYDSIFAREHPDVIEALSVFLPEIFEYRESVQGFLGLVDLGILNRFASESECLVDTLEEISWLDRETATFCLSLVTHNDNGVGRYGIIDICFDVAVGGSMNANVEIASGVLVHKDEQSDAIAITAIYLAWVCVNLCYYLAKVVRNRKFFFRKVKRVFWVVIEVAFYTLQIFACAYFYKNVVYGEYDEFIPFDSSSPEDLFQSLLIISDLIDTQRALRYLYGALLFIMVVRTINFLEFHHDVALVGYILRHGAQDLLSFAFVFFVIICTYAFMGVLLFSYEGDAFSKFAVSLRTLLFMSVGEYDSAVASLYNDTYVASLGMTNLFFWSFVFFTSLILFNVLLSIVVNAYVDLQERKQNRMHFSFLESFLLFMSAFAYDVKHFYSTWICQTCTKCRKRAKPSIKKETQQAQGQVQGDLEDRTSEEKTVEDLFFSADMPPQEFERLTLPHKFLDRNRVYKRWCRKDMPTFVVREQYEKIFSSGQVERVLALMRERSSQHSTNLSKQELEMFFGKKDSDLYIIAMTQRILRVVEQNQRIFSHSHSVVSNPPMPSPSTPAADITQQPSN